MFFLTPLPRTGIMDYIEKLDKLDKHIQDNPKDYQAVISRLKTQSKAIDYYRKQHVNMRLKKVAEIKRKYEQEHNE